MKRQLLFALFSIGLMAVSVLLALFSWLPDPLLSNPGWLPERVGRWADHPDNINLRTALPMVAWGLLAGWILYFRDLKIRWWILSGIAGALMVGIAELGQIWIPNRHPDWVDLAWGCLGLFAGMLLVRVFGWCLPGLKATLMKDR